MTLSRSLQHTHVLTILLLSLVVSGGSIPRQATLASPQQSNTISYWGMNAYIAKRERLDNRNGVPRDNLPLLADLTKNAGAEWTREELPWDLIEPSDDTFSTVYDGSLTLIADKGLNIIGVLLTTPQWARDPSCRPQGAAYWCPPSNVREYAEFARWMVERYDGDGVDDAPGSPRIAAWEIWNEPNDTLLWPEIGSSNGAPRQRRYGEMLVAAFTAIRQADPTAKVLVGGVYVYDGSYCEAICDGLVFLDGVFQQVPLARQSFHVLAIHPYIPTERPDAPNIPRLITVEGRIRSTRDRLDGAYNRPDAPIWITEMGWCTATGACPGGVQVSEEQQANYLTRSMVIAQRAGVQHSSWFQLEDAFNDANREWANSAILRQYNGSSYDPKPAYLAYRTASTLLSGAAPAGLGPVHSHVYDPSQPYVNDNGTYDYRYTGGTSTIDVLWVPMGARSVFFQVDPGKPVTLIDRDGGQQVLAVSGGGVQLALSERPIFIVQGDLVQAPRLAVAPSALQLLAQVGTPTVSGALSINNAGGGTLTWTASTSTPWLRLESTSGTAPSSLRVIADTRRLAAGTYEGSIRIVGSTNAGTVDVPVRLIIASRIYRSGLPLVRR